MISVLLPVRNGAATLNTALDSLWKQRLQPTSCVVVDDGSVDATPLILEEWRKRWPALRVARTSGIGIARALNIGIALCDSDWIARMDADDFCHAERLQRQYETTRTDERLSLVGTVVAHAASDAAATEGMRKHIEWANRKISHEELAHALWVDSPLPHPSWLVHRRAFEIVGEYEESGRLPEDYEWLHRFFAAADRGESLRAGKTAGEPLLRWTDAPARLTRTHEAYLPQAFDAVKAKALRKFLSRRQPRELFVFGLGPKAKAFLPRLLENEIKVHAIVDVNPRRQGMLYHDIEVWDVERWRQRASGTFVLSCVGTEEARDLCEQFCVDNGLKPGLDFLSV